MQGGQHSGYVDSENCARSEKASSEHRPVQVPIASLDQGSDRVCAADKGAVNTRNNLVPGGQWSVDCRRDCERHCHYQGSRDERSSRVRRVIVMRCLLHRSEKPLLIRATVRRVLDRACAVVSRGELDVHRLAAWRATMRT